MLMREASKDHRLMADSLPEVRHGLEMEKLRLRRQLKMKHGDRGVFEAHLINYLICEYLSQPIAERNERIRKGERDYKALQASDRPSYFNVDDPDPASSVSPSPPVAQGRELGAPAAEPRRKRRA
jgi:hypothetical protein